MGPDELPTRRLAEAGSRDPLEPANRWKACGWTFEHAGRVYWVKDIHRAHPLFRATVGRWTLWREARIHARLAGLRFVPRYVGRLDRDALVFEFVAGLTPIGKFCKEHELPPHFFDTLEAQVRELHGHGVLHMDLRHRTNLLVDAEGRPFLVDFETGLYLGRGPLSFAFLRPLLGWADHSAVVKFRARYRPESLSASQRRRHRWFSRLRRLWPFGRVWPRKARRQGRAPTAPVQPGRRLSR